MFGALVMKITQKIFSTENLTFQKKHHKFAAQN
jgi:hypothetical protein